MYRVERHLSPTWSLRYSVSFRLYTFDQSLACRKRAAILLFLGDIWACESIPANWQQPVDNENPDEIAEYFEAYGQDIRGFLRRRVNSPEQADDLLQQVFLRLMGRADWKEVRNPEAYLRATARHVLADFYRTQNSRDKGVVLEYQESWHADETWQPDKSLLSHELVNRLAAVLESLSPKVQRAFVLSRVYGHTYKQIGEILSISPRTVEKHVAKAVARCVESELNASDSSEAGKGLSE